VGPLSITPLTHVAVEAKLRASFMSALNAGMDTAAKGKPPCPYRESNRR